MTEETELFCAVDQLDLADKELTYSETEAIHKMCIRDRPWAAISHLRLEFFIAFFQQPKGADL